ncbi:putative pyridoxal phosphate-dependent protein [Geoglobus ahangari]|uniref:Putative pyridoxal phosphate-dependent protein n=1 Tax=Geoglobus ahangari TaxID=113653 RepID=A0A0F7IFJ1_9EURY|nr:DegT/DnrJ/EryC1/StrS family aminotransferase [Geoglobus ahangari]AKG91243.1 putative pyridoxal phosphate-dependent protein [Geoglobus ahangari]
MVMNIPFARPYITQEEIRAVTEVLKSGWLSMGEKTVMFERAFAEYIGSKYAVATNSCTSALFLSLKVLGIGRGDEVILPTFTFTATANTVVHCGAKPVFVDIDEKTYNIDPDSVEERITDNTKAIIVVHYAGQPADMRKIMKIAKTYGLKVIEDAAHAAGAKYENGKKVGALGNLTCFSFYATKPMTTGEGGMITLDDGYLADKLRILRLHGISKDAWKRYLENNSWYYEVIEAGYKCNPTDLASAIGLEQLRKLDWMNTRRKKIAEYYNEHLNDLDIILPYVRPKIESAYHLYPIRLVKYNRDKFINEMAKRGVGTSVHFMPLHLTRFYRKMFKYKKGDFPVAERVFRSIVSLPIYPQLTERHLEYVVRCVKEILKPR